MTNQIVIRVHCDRGTEFLCDSNSHVYNYEQAAFAQLSGVVARTVDSHLGVIEPEQLFPLIRRYALAYHVVYIPAAEVDRRGVHAANIEGMRRAVAGLPVRPGYVLSDGFRVPGLPIPSLPVVGGDAAAACIAAASVLAKVSRDRLMVAMESEHPGYGFADHKGYSTPAHGAALAEHGACRQHRQSFINVRRVARAGGSDLVAEFAPVAHNATSDTTAQGATRWNQQTRREDR
jgi:ribonuclease HII